MVLELLADPAMTRSRIRRELEEIVRLVDERGVK